jgi:integrase
LHAPVVLPVDGQGCDFWKACFAVALRAVRPLLSRAQDRCAAVIADWIAAADITEGPLIRSIDQWGHLSPGGMSTTSAYKIVLKYAKEVGVTCAPHDLRRTFGRLTHASGAAIEQISRTFGHSNIKTTERYLGIEQNLKHAPCDNLDIEAGTTKGGK